MNRTLAQWLEYIETQHPVTEIHLGLDRVTEVAKRLDLLKPAPYVFTVAGTNGKGTTCRALEMILLASGKRVGVYSSPHILKYNERVRINGVDCEDEHFVQAFMAIEASRKEIELTYFEYATLAALWQFKQAQLDVVILEVGLGGRLDATNIVNAEMAVITSIAIDHTDYLGDTRELIGYEKAGIFKPNRTAIIGDPDCPESIKMFAQQQNVTAHYCAPNSQFDWGYEYGGSGDEWSFYSRDLKLNLLVPNIPIQNAATALAALTYSGLDIDESAIKSGLQNTVLVGRFQIIQDEPLTIVDVAHNPHAARYLQSKVQQLIKRKNFSGKIRMVVGMLKDKDIAATLQELSADYWYFASLSGIRGATAESLNTSKLRTEPDANTALFNNVKSAYEQAKSESSHRDLIIVCGSFHTVSEVLALC